MTAGAHRRPAPRVGFGFVWHVRREAPWRASILPVLLAAASVAGGLMAGTALASPPPTPPPPAPVVVAPPPAPVRIPAVHEMTVYDDDTDRGQERCSSWSSFYPAGAATCRVLPIGEAPSPERAEKGAAWWEREHGEQSDENDENE